MPDPARASKLKEEANALFTSKKYKEAYSKYSDALSVGGDNAIIYANRSACSVQLRRVFDAISDAKKATEIDPTYVKAWGRLGASEAANMSWDKSIAAYTTALDKLNSRPGASQLTSAELKQKDSYESAIELAKQEIKKQQEREVLEDAHVMRSVPLPAKTSWESARDYLVKLKEAGRDEDATNSSALIINMAANDLEEAKSNHRRLRQVKVGGRTAFSGTTQVIECYCSCITTDDRAFYTDDGSWLNKYNNQVTLEVSQRNCQGWQTLSAEDLMKEAQKRVRTEGWEGTRPALAVIIRGWIMNGFLSSELKKDNVAAVERLQKAADAIRLGRSLWSDVDENSKGTTFSTTFLFATEKLLLERLLMARTQTFARDERFSLDRIENEAKSLYNRVEDARKNLFQLQIRKMGPEHFLAFYIYPSGEALRCLGYVEKKRAENASGDKIKELMEKSGMCYSLAADKLPRDDELHCQDLVLAIESYGMAGTAPYEIVLPLFKKLEEDTPQMRNIWQNSSLAKSGRDHGINKWLEVYRDIQIAMRDGKLAMNGTFMPVPVSED